MSFTSPNLPDSSFIVDDNGQIRVDSRTLAEYFGKRHGDVLRAIEELEIPEEYHERNFALMSCQVSIGNGAHRDSKYYQLTRDGFTLLAMGFTGKKAMRYKIVFIEAFNAMEKELLRQRQETIERLQGPKPKPQFPQPQPTPPEPSVRVARKPDYVPPPLDWVPPPFQEHLPPEWGNYGPTQRRYMEEPLSPSVVQGWTMWMREITGGTPVGAPTPEYYFLKFSLLEYLGVRNINDVQRWMVPKMINYFNRWRVEHPPIGRHWLPWG